MKYVKPNTVVRARVSHSFLAGSGVNTGSSVSNVYNNEDQTYSKDMNLWEEE